MKKIITHKMSNLQQSHNTIQSNKTRSITGLCASLASILQLIFIVLTSLALSSTAYAHRGAKGEVDTCRFSVGKDVVHFSAYTPASSGGKSYCHAIPNIELTDLVIDYEGKNLRNTTVEFEVTREPEGTRILYQAPEKFKKGSVDFKIDFERGQQLISLHDTVVLQHPLYWYSCPALLKEWLDKVFVRGFAYGRQAKALEGKNLVSIVSAGGPEETYGSDGSNEYAVQDFLNTFKVTARFCSMVYPPPLIIHNTYRASENEISDHLDAYSQYLSRYSSL